MAKLTRTQKYAGLRNELANDKETSTTSQDLSGYVDRFNNVKNILSPEDTTTNEPEYTWQPATGAPTRNTNWQNMFDDNGVDIKPVELVNGAVQSMPASEPVYAQQTVAQPTYVQPQAPVQQQYVQPQAPVQPTVQATPVQPTYVQPQATPVQPQVVAQPTYVEPTPVQEPVQAQPVVEENPLKNDSYFDSFMNAPKQETKADSFDFNSLFESNDAPAANKEVFNDVVDKTDEAISAKERDTYLGETISDVNMHNMVNGEKSLNQIIDNAVDEVRHSDNKPVDDVMSGEAINPFANNNEPLDADAITNTTVPEQKVDTTSADEEFFNTVTVEISKIMDQMNTEPVQETKVVEPEPVKVEEPVVQAAPVVEEKPEEVVEIKNISELKDEPLKDTVSSTIPFVVSTNEDEDIEEDEDEEDGSNTILNIILIVLIIVLVAVLGLIIFYILKTKGIL